MPVSMRRVRVHWNGFPGAPGVNTWFFPDTAGATTALHTFYAAFASSLPTDVTISFDTAGDIIHDDTGALAGTWTDAAAANVVGGSPTVYAGPSGYCVNLHTASIVRRRRLMGRIFLVPGNNFSSSGAPASAALSAINGAGAALAAGTPAPLVWSRPTFDGATPGSSAPVTAITAAAKAVVLRSRRD